MSIHTTWTYCKKCMGQHDHIYVKGRGWICKSCKKPSTILRYNPYNKKKEQVNG